MLLFPKQRVFARAPYERDLQSGKHLGASDIKVNRKKPFTGDIY